jgi:hypothetical protein
MEQSDGIPRGHRMLILHNPFCVYQLKAFGIPAEYHVGRRDVRRCHSLRNM